MDKAQTNKINKLMEIYSKSKDVTDFKNNLKTLFFEGMCETDDQQDINNILAEFYTESKNPHPLSPSKWFKEHASATVRRCGSEPPLREFGDIDETALLRPRPPGDYRGQWESWLPFPLASPGSVDHEHPPAILEYWADPIDPVADRHVLGGGYKRKPKRKSSKKRPKRKKSIKKLNRKSSKRKSTKRKTKRRSTK